MNCTACSKELKDEDIVYEVNKGIFNGADDLVIPEEEKGVYHEACFPTNVPEEPSEES